MYCWNVFKPFNVIPIQSDLNSLTSASINNGCASASKQLWQSPSHILWIHKNCHSLGSVLLLRLQAWHPSPTRWLCSSTLLFRRASTPRPVQKALDVRHCSERLLGRAIAESRWTFPWPWKHLSLDRIILCDFFSFLCLIVLNEILKHSHFWRVCYWVMMHLKADEKRENRCREMFLLRGSLTAVRLTCRPPLICPVQILCSITTRKILFLLYVLWPCFHSDRHMTLKQVFFFFVGI